VNSNNKTVLGVTWDTLTDEFVFQFDEFLEKCAVPKRTKQNLLSVSASIFDPLGFIAPVTTIFQLLCKDKLDWDDLIPQKLALVWNRFLEELKCVREVRQPRFVLYSIFPSGSRVELHGFCDSSTEVYCAVVYLRLIHNDCVNVYFVAAKTKVAPLKTVRLELLGCMLLSKLVAEVVEGIRDRVKLDDIVCWSDSAVVLCWIKGKERGWEPWVENRVVAIRKVVARDQWKFIKGELNPADVPTRISSNLVECFSGSGHAMLLSTPFESADSSSDYSNHFLWMGRLAMMML
jgi:hypothetical protein